MLTDVEDFFYWLLLRLSLISSSWLGGSCSISPFILNNSLFLMKKSLNRLLFLVVFATGGLCRWISRVLLALCYLYHLAASPLVDTKAICTW
jgi:hypothetical protein